MKQRRELWEVYFPFICKRCLLQKGCKSERECGSFYRSVDSAGESGSSWRLTVHFYLTSWLLWVFPHSEPLWGQSDQKVGRILKAMVTFTLVQVFRYIQIFDVHTTWKWYLHSRSSVYMRAPWRMHIQDARMAHALGHNLDAHASRWSRERMSESYRVKKNMLIEVAILIYFGHKVIS